MDNNISFDEDKYKIRSRSILGMPQTPKMISFLVGKKIVKSERHAMTLLLIITGLSVVATMYIVKSNFFPSANSAQNSSLEKSPWMTR
jgi:hypothetical protein